jgi:hypothetical protein
VRCVFPAARTNTNKIQKIQITILTNTYRQTAAGAATLNNIANTAIQHKLSRYVDTSMSLVQNGIYGAGNTLMTVTNLANEFRPYYETKTGTGGQYMIRYDYAVVKLNH